MKFSLVLLAFIGIAFAAPSTDHQADPVESVDDEHVKSDINSPLIEAAEEDIEEINRKKKSPGPKTVCFETKDLQGRSFFQCVEDAEIAAPSSYPSYAPAAYAPAPSYSSPSYSPPAPTYHQVSLNKKVIQKTNKILKVIFITARTKLFCSSPTNLFCTSSLLQGEMKV